MFCTVPVICAWARMELVVVAVVVRLSVPFPSTLSFSVFMTGWLLLSAVLVEVLLLLATVLSVRVVLRLLLDVLTGLPLAVLVLVVLPDVKALVLVLVLVAVVPAVRPWPELLVEADMLGGTPAAAAGAVAGNEGEGETATWADAAQAVKATRAQAVGRS